MKRILVGQPLSAVAQLAEDWCEMPTVDQAGVSGNYDFTFEWPNAMSPATAGRSAEIRHLFDDQLANELGLEMVPTNMPLEVLVVEKVK